MARSEHFAPRERQGGCQPQQHVSQLHGDLPERIARGTQSPGDPGRLQTEQPRFQRIDQAASPRDTFRAPPHLEIGTSFMAQKLAIIAEIKRTLKERDITYAEVARHMKLSLPSVKRLLSTGDLSLDRLDQICELLGMEPTELIEQMRQRAATVTRLTNAQEREIIADPRLFLMAWLIINRWRLEDIVEAFRFT